MVGDRCFYHPLYQTVHQYLSYGNTTENPLYLMKFDYQGPASSSSTDQEPTPTEWTRDLGILHGDDLVYYFSNSARVPVFGRNTLEGKMSHILVQTLVNFATTDSIQMWQSVEPCRKDITTDMCDYQVFQRYTKSEPNRILISVRNAYDKEMVAFWDEIVEHNFQ